MRMVRLVLLVSLLVLGCSSHRGAAKVPVTTTLGSVTTASSSPLDPKISQAHSRPVPVLFGRVVLVGEAAGGFTDVTPAHGENEFIYDAFFGDRQHGWVGFTDSAAASGRLVRTVDGGRTWVATNLTARQHQSAGSRVWLDFLDNRYGWASDSAAAGGAVMYKTGDGGQTWSDYKTLETVRGPVRFDTPRHGWMAAWAGPEPGPGLYESVDGGDTWTERPVPAPSGVSSDQLTFRLPIFDGSRGVLAAAGSNQVLFYNTTDRGQHWRLATTLTVENQVRAGISVASDRVWWVIPDTTGKVMVTENAGTTWTGTSRNGLPKNIDDVEATDARHAWASAFNDGGILRLYQTTDGGETWQLVEPDTAR